MALPGTEQLDALLPQTQCGRCGYDGCAPYAQAMAQAAANINRCPPGGAATVAALAQITGLPAQPIDPECGPITEPSVARIREDECIGCTRCIQACPVDAIVGAAKLMHTVLADECTGCGLCLPACPVDCIDLPAAAAGEGQVRWPPPSDDDARRADRARRRFVARNRRLQDLARQRRQRRTETTAAVENSSERKREIARAIARARAKRAQRQPR